MDDFTRSIVDQIIFSIGGILLGCTILLIKWRIEDGHWTTLWDR